jgi:DNA ligase D-like protein (predicted 3'-phosphoesterase)
MGKSKSKDKLKKYKKKRDFSKTKEPENSGKSHKKKRIFVIQKHDATNLHYDLRIEIDGVLVSWAVPKGPSTDPSEKRLAQRTEDHPLDYADFEGVIPEDEYGGGTVLVWDKGTYKNIRKDKEDDKANMKESLDEGKIEVDLKGEKLKGGYNLIRTGSKKEGKWLLIKAKDDEADARRNPVSTEPKSVKSGKTLKEIAKENE